MLSYLAVKNVAILENIEVYFKPGFTVLTGETGAGKSLLIDAIGLLLGDRANASMIRSGFEHCEITGLFTNIPPQVVSILKDLDIPYEDQECLIKRQITTTSANIIKVNQQTVTLADLRTITQYLADIHTQHDTKRLINPDTYLTIIDLYNPAITSVITNYQTEYTNYLTARDNYLRLIDSQSNAEDKQRLLESKIEEIEKLNLKQGELEAIEEELSQLQNFDKIYKYVTMSYENLKDFDALEKIYETAESLREISDVDAQYQTLSERVESSYFELLDIKDSLSQIHSKLDFDPERLEYLETREHSLKTLSRKYHKTIEELIVYKEELQSELNQYENIDETIEEAYKVVLTHHDKLKNAAMELTKIRKQIAKDIEKKLIDVLKDLELRTVDFEIAFEPVKMSDPLDAKVFTERGTDSIDFYLSTNVGEIKKPLSKVASGGELSRIMLGLKEIFMRQMNLSLMIFDEIDTGVSGYVASQVAIKMKEIAKQAQVLSITHLPQVAAKADQHYKIFKQSDGQRTQAYLDELSQEDRIEAIAEMISSEEITEDARKSAQNLLK